MATLADLAKDVLTAAYQARPGERAAILQQGAVRFAQLSASAKTQKAKEAIAGLGFEFARQAMEWPQHSLSQDDFSRLLEETQRATYAAEQAGVSPSNLAMAAISQREGQVIGTASPAGTPHMSVQPASFTVDTTLGRTANVTANPTQEQILQGVKNLAVVALWQGSKIESQAMTVDVGLTAQTLPIIPTKGLNNRPFARIVYGADGNAQTSVDVDIGLGKRFTVVGNYISVAVGMDQVPPGTFSGEMILGASIGTFAAPSAAPVVRSVYADALVAGVESAPFAIPLRATRLMPPLPTLSFTDTITIRFLNDAGTGTVAVWESIYSPTTPFQVPFIVPSSSYFFTVKSAAGNPLVIPFELSL
jgi:hypothetical protein